MKKDIPYFLLILIISVVFVFDLFFVTGRPASFDEIVHVTNIEQFSQGMRSGNLPVYWLGNFANYGMPIPIIAQQTNNYLGGAVNLIVRNPVLSYNIVVFLGVFLSSLFYFLFLRMYFKPIISFAGTFLFTFSAYRILDIYVRGDLPEILATVCLPLILIGFFQWLHYRKFYSLILLTVAFFLLSVTHPMMMVVFAPLYGIYFLFNLYVTGKGKSWKEIAGLALTPLIFALLGLGLAGYYLIPLNLEIRYFVQGSYKNALAKGYFLGFDNFLRPAWYYFYRDDIYPRGHFVTPGSVEVLLFILALVLIPIGVIRKWTQDKAFQLLAIFILVSLITLFMTTQYSNMFYQVLPVINKILFPWRFLLTFAFIPPVVICFVLEKLDKRLLTISVVIFVVLVGLLRFPQLYGKNYIQFPQSTYRFTKENLYSSSLNTVWMGDSSSYPVKTHKDEIIEGKGSMEELKIKNSYREYYVMAQTPLRVADYTFYFPGWKVYIDGSPTVIQFQDPNHRGYITYGVPAGKHTVILKFEDTLVRRFGKMVSLLSVGTIILVLVFRKRIKKRMVYI